MQADEVGAQRGAAERSGVVRAAPGPGPQGSEVDFVWERGKRRVGIEVKAAKTWRREHASTLVDLLSERDLTAAFAVYTGQHPLADRGVRVLPIVDFLRELGAGSVLA